MSRLSGPQRSNCPTTCIPFLQRQGKRDEACELLALVYSWFIERFDTAVLQEAKALLDELAG